MAKIVEGTFVNTRSQTLYHRRWEAPGRPRAFLIFHHGYGSHSVAYPTELQRLAEAGISVFAFDAHSFGRSEPKAPKQRSLVQSYQHLVDDVYTFKAEVVDKAQPSPPVPVFLGGLSMGGMTAILAALRDQSQWQGLIAISPAVDCARTLQLKLMEAIQGVVLRVSPGARLVPGPQVDTITFNTAERERLLADEHFDAGKVRVRMANTFLQAWTHIARHERELALPLLVVYSTIDKVVYPPATERFLRNVASSDSTAVPYENFAHDLLLDDCKTEVVAQLADWMLARAGGGGGGGSSGSSPPAAGAAGPAAAAAQAAPSQPQASL